MQFKFGFRFSKSRITLRQAHRLAQWALSVALNPSLYDLRLLTLLLRIIPRQFR